MYNQVQQHKAVCSMHDTESLATGGGRGKGNAKTRNLAIAGWAIYSYPSEHESYITSIDVTRKCLRLRKNNSHHRIVESFRW